MNDRTRDLEAESVAQRTGVTDPDGKLNVPFEFLTTEKMSNDILAVATVKRISRGEYVRRLIARDLYGEMELMRRSVRDTTD